MYTSNYEQLMNWTIRNIDSKLYNLGDLGYSIQELDIHNVINNNEQFIEFIKDLENRTGKSIIENKERERTDNTMNVIRLFFNEHYINLNVWELNYMRNIKGLKKLSEKQLSCVIRIMDKIDKRYSAKLK